ncbi:MAG: UPF0182 family membrane protein [Mycobacteriales bacterium]
MLRPRVVIPVVAVLVVLVVFLVVGTNLYTDLLFYREVGFSEVFTTVLHTKIVLFVVFGLVMAIAIGTNITVAYLVRPAFRPMSPEQQALERYRTLFEPYRVLILLAACTAFGIAAGSADAGRWRTVQLWLHGQSFGVKDPQFHRDISYYAFTYPFERMVLSFLFSAVLLSLLVSLIVHYLVGAIRVQTPGEKVLPAARGHISVLLGVFVLLKAAAYYLDRFGLNFSPRGSVTGAGYADVHATLPAKTILLVIALICAALFFANVNRRGFALPGIALGLLVLSAIVIGGVYPAIVQQFTVKPNEINLEAPYIQRNIDATQRAYQIVPSSRPGGTVQVNNFSATAPASSALVAADPSIPQTRLLDPLTMQPTFEQLQQNRSYYTFPNSLAVDRYTINGQTEPYLVAMRDINLAGLRSDQQNWVNLHLIYTHGIGFVAAPANAVDSKGLPIFTVGNIPPSGLNGGPPPIPITQPRIYYGLNSPTYSIVHTTQQEIDGADLANYTYSGTGGVSIGSTFRRLLFALRFRDRNILLSSALTGQSRIMYYRNPITRVEKVAPWLTLDGDPYPAVINGRLVWILDGYTTTDMYPYSERISLATATSNTSTATGATNAQPDVSINYIRNSVKATVDAFNGTVTLYAFDPTDPVLRTWMKIFPGTVQPMSAISPALQAHLRYPEDLFDIQRYLLTRYHISDARTFFRGNDFWSVPLDPSNKDNTYQPPYYQMLQAPGQTHPEFDLTSVLVASNRPNLAAFVSVSSDPPDYGVMRILQLPTGTTLQGPANVSNEIESDATVSSQLTLLRGGGSMTLTGNLLTLPVGNGLLFVEPIYVQSTSGTQTFPTLQRVAVVYGGTVGFGPSLASALQEVFGTAPPGTQAGGGTATVRPVASRQLAALIAAAQADYNAAQQALRQGNFAGYGADTQKLAQDLAQLGAAASAPPSPSPASSPTATPARSGAGGASSAGGSAASPSARASPG